MISENNILEKQINSLIVRELNERRTRNRYEKGTVKILSPQGDRLYVLVQRLPKTVEDEKGNKEIVPGEYFGNNNNLSKDKITLTECLIETDIDLSLTYSDLTHFVGKEVTVMSIDGKPIKAYLQSPQIEPRTMSREDVIMARYLSASKEDIDQAGIDYLLQKGYTKKVIDVIIAETISSISRAGVTDYGTPSWSNNEKKGGDLIDNKKVAEADAVTGLPPPLERENSFCFKPAKVLTGK